MTSIESFQERLQHRFSQIELLQRALTHRSFSADHNERLEFLGDAVLDLAVAHRLYESFRDSPEGRLSRMRSALVREESLHAMALTLDLPSLLRLGAGEQRSGGRRRASILADAMEAVIGAVYLDGGFAAADALVRRLLGDRITRVTAPTLKDPKTALQEWLQARRLERPQYEILRCTGAQHAPTFEVACRVPERDLETTGQGTSRREAEQAAAAVMLKRLEPQP